VKSYLPNYREFYEGRQFSPAEEAVAKTIRLCGQEGIPSARTLFSTSRTSAISDFFWRCARMCGSPSPLPASPRWRGNGHRKPLRLQRDDRKGGIPAGPDRKPVRALHLGLPLRRRGAGESTTDLAWDGHAMIYENGNLLAESQRFANNSQIIRADIDLDRLVQDRMRQTSFGANARTHCETLLKFRRVALEIEPVGGRLLLEREYARFPYIPADPATRNQRCYEAYNIQVQGLSQRLKASGIDKVVIGVSGGLDSTHALMVAARTMDLLAHPAPTSWHTPCPVLRRARRPAPMP